MELLLKTTVAVEEEELGRLQQMELTDLKHQMRSVELLERVEMLIVVMVELVEPMVKMV